MDTLALVYGRAGKHEQSVALLEEKLQLVKAKLGPEHSETFTA
jgi:hypothetical protein